jgi:glycosyltransferase involved in cell wall biosynthesis
MPVSISTTTVMNSMSQIATLETTPHLTAGCRTINVLMYVHMRNIYHSTGAGRVARQLTEHLALRKGVNIRILADQGDHRALIDKLGEPWTSFPYYLFQKDTAIQQRQWLLLHRPAAQNYWPEAEIVHCTGESYVPKSKARLVVTVHDAAYFEKDAHQRSLATLGQSLRWRILYAALSRTADVFHTVSNFSAERLGTVFPSIRSRLRVIHNAVSPRFFEPCNAVGEDFLQRNGLTRRPYVLWPGGLQYRKNGLMALEAWPILSQRRGDLKLVVAGHCDPALKARGEALGTSVLFTGFVEDDELQALYHGAQATWFPSRYEGFGMPVLEAMASGSAVVASKTTSIPEIAGDAAVLVDPNSVSENVDALDAIVESTAHRERLISQGGMQAQRFTWDASAARLHELYSSLL